MALRGFDRGSMDKGIGSLRRNLWALPSSVYGCGVEVAACGLELAGADSREFAPAARRCRRIVCLLHSLLARARGECNRSGYRLWRSVYRSRRTRQRDGRAVPPGEVGGRGPARVAEFCGDVNDLSVLQFQNERA